MSNTSRIAKNTLMLYFRQILIMLVSLYTVRVVLETLGAEDYGIYNVVAGVVTMFGFLSNSMATATQRYLSFELGRNDFDRLKKVFSLSLTIYVLIVLVVLLLAETIGLWFVSNKLVIPLERKNAALWVYQFSIISFLFAVIITPYKAAIIAHENMHIYAYISIVEVTMKLLIVFILQICLMDKLKLYGILMFMVTFINIAMYGLIGTKKYKECTFRFYWDGNLFKELTGFIGWSLFGATSSIVRQSGITILLNIYFGPIVNAARAVALQVEAAVLSFAQNFTTAVRPQIVKYYAIGNKKSMLQLVFQSSRFTFFLLFLFILPLQLELYFVLRLWLKQIPEYVLIFIRILLVNTLIDSLNYPLAGASQATGNIKLYQSIVGGILILNLPISLLVLVLGFSPVSVQVIGLLLAICAFFARILILSKQLLFSIPQYIKNVILPISSVGIIGSLIPIIWVFVCPDGIFRLFITVLISTVSIIVTVFFIGLSHNERLSIIAKIKAVLPQIAGR